MNGDLLWVSPAPKDKSMIISVLALVISILTLAFAVFVAAKK